MKFSLSLFALLSAVCAVAGKPNKATITASLEQRRLQREFMKAMHPAKASPKAASKQARFNKRILSKARRLDQDNGNYNYDGDNDADADANDANDGNDANDANDANDGNDNQQADGNADYYDNANYNYNYDGDWYNENYYDGEYDLINLANFAFKYTGCSAMEEFDEEAAREANENGGSPIVVRSYAVFSLCPVDSCNSYTVIGCSENYGQYIVPMGDYLEALTEYYEERYQEYCEYCEPCSQYVQQEGLDRLEECFEEMYQQQLEEMEENGGNYNYANYAGNMAANNYYNGGNNYNNNNYYNGNNNYNNNNNNGNRALRERKLQNNYYSNNAYDQNAIEMAQAAYGYYDENGGWVDGSEEAMSDLQASQYQYMGPGVYGADGQWYPADSNDECVQEYFNDYTCSDDMADLCSEYSTYCFEEEQEQKQQNYENQNNNNNNNNNNGNNNNNNNNGNNNNNQNQQVDFDLDVQECTKYENQYGRVYYFAPHCSSDHFSIRLGVFYDENCASYSGDDVSISQILGREDDYESIFFFPRECIYCNGQDKLQGYDSNEYNEDNGEEEQAEDDEGVVEMCEQLYEGAATCNVNLEAWQNSYKTDSQISQEEATCEFLEAIRSGKSESNSIVISSASFDLADWRNLDQYKNLGIPFIEVIGLIVSISLVIILSITLCLTQRQFNEVKTPFKPRMPTDGVKFSRQDSGIGMARSRSGPGKTPLI